MIGNIERRILSFIWNNKIHYLKKNYICRPKDRGGLALSNLSLKQKSFILDRFKILNKTPKHPWEAIYIYLFGYICKFNNGLKCSRDSEDNVLCAVCKILLVPKKLSDDELRDELKKDVRDEIMTEMQSETLLSQYKKLVEENKYLKNMNEKLSKQIKKINLVIEKNIKK